MLICIKCKAQLFKKNNYLICIKNKKHTYNIKNKIYSFYSSSEEDFDQQWLTNSNINLQNNRIKAAKSFLKPLINQNSYLQTILDAGCGDGVHASVLANKKISHLKINYIGLDTSKVAVNLTAKRFNKKKGGNYLHASATNLPLKNECIDILFSYGVVAYTRYPKKALKEFFRVLKKGGKLGIWVYIEPKGLNKKILYFIRKITSYNINWLTNIIADCIVPFLSLLPVDSKINLFNSSWKQCREMVLMNIKPRGLSFPSLKQLIDWIIKANFKIEKIENGKIYALKN